MMRNAKEMIQELVLMIEEYAENAVANALRTAPTATAPTVQGYSREQVRRAYIDGQADDATADTVEEYLATLTPEGEKP
jgi:hypothetical protein